MKQKTKPTSYYSKQSKKNPSPFETKAYSDWPKITKIILHQQSRRNSDKRFTKICCCQRHGRRTNETRFYNKNRLWWKTKVKPGNILNSHRPSTNNLQIYILNIIYHLQLQVDPERTTLPINQQWLIQNTNLTQST